VLPLFTGAGALRSHVRLPAIVLFTIDDGPVFLLNVRFPPISFVSMEKASPSASLDWIVRFPVIVEPSMKLPSVSLLIETFPPNRGAVQIGEQAAVAGGRVTRRRSPGLFCGFWFDLDGRRLRRMTRREIAEAYRLWAKHRDVREGRVQV